MDISWISYWPAVGRRRYWRKFGWILLGGSLTGALIYGLLASVAGVAGKVKSGEWPNWLLNSDGWSWVSLVLACWLMGSLVYAAKRVYETESGGDAADAIDALESIEFPFPSGTANGRELLGLWGMQFTTAKPYGEWSGDVIDDMAWLRTQKPSSSITPKSISGSSLRAAGVIGAFTRLSRAIELHGLVEIVESSAPHEVNATYRLTAAGRTAVLTAGRIPMRRRRELGR